MDPTLGKILRNIRLATQTLQNYSLVERFGEQCIMPAMCDSLEHLPALEANEIEQELHRIAHPTDHVPGLLAKLSLFLRTQESASRIVAVMAVGVAIRSFYEQQSLPAEAQVDILDQIQVHELAGVLEEACKQVRNETERKYVTAGKVTGKDFDAYFAVIRELLVDRIVNHDGDARSLFERLNLVMPGLTKEQYRSSHRAKLEYLARMTESRAKTEVRKMMFDRTRSGS